MSTSDEQDLRNLLEMLHRASSWESLTTQPSGEWVVHEGSSLAGDDRKSSPYQLSHAAWNALTVAVDHLRCLRSSLVVDETDERASVVIHTHAQSSLIRGVVENAARAVWLLSPSARSERVTRRLALQLKEVRHFHHLRELMRSPADRNLKQHEKRVHEVATAAGIADLKTLRTPKYSDIVREAGDRTKLGADLVEAVWSSSSAIAHGDFYGTIGLLDREIVGSGDGVVLAQVTASVSSLFWTTAVAVRMLEHGLDLYRRNANRQY